MRADASGSYTGGLVGLVYSGVINNSNASGAVTSRDSINSNSDEYTGGLVGYFGIYNDQGRISGSNATGAVNGGYYNGGLVGFFNGGAVSNSTASGSVSNGRETGGLMGYAVLYGPMSNVSASGRRHFHRKHRQRRGRWPAGAGLPLRPRRPELRRQHHQCLGQRRRERVAHQW